MHRPTATSVSGYALPIQKWLRSRGALNAGAYVVGYVLLDWLSYVQPVLKLGITPWNPQAGLTLAFLLICGPRWLPVTGLAVCLSEVLVRGTPAPFPLLLAASVWIAIGYGALAAGLRVWGVDQLIRSPTTAARLAAGSVVATLLVAAGYVALFAATGNLPRDVVGASVARYWVGDVNGILTVTPLLLCASEWRAGLKALHRHRWEVSAQLAAVALTIWLIFGLAPTDELRFFYPLFVPVIWIALRWGVPGAVLAALTIQIGLLIAAQEESGTAPLVDLQFLMLTLSLTGLLLGAVVAERADALRRVAARESEQRTLLATAPDAVLTVDAAGCIQTANHAALRIFGDIAPGKRPLAELLPAIQLRAPVGRATLDGRRLDGTIFPAETAWAQFDAHANQGFLVIVRDATDRRRAEAQLRERDTALARAMRFAVAGELASALAHELNQPITALVSYLRAAEILAAPFAAHDERLRATLEKTAQEAIRASEVLRRMRDFYRGGSWKREAVSIQTLCSTVSSAFQERLRQAGVQLAMRIGVSLPQVNADGMQLEIVLHNLLANAIDAVSQIAAPARRIELTAEQAAEDVIVRVEDSGPGISADVASRLFEPFVTTKSDGMGLGLAISRSLLRARAGDLVCERGARLGGACFVMRVPIRARREVAA